MNRREWKDSCNFSSGSYYWYNKARKLLKSREYESLERCKSDSSLARHRRAKKI